MKTCVKCSTPKLLTDFYRHPHGGDGRMAVCKACKCAYTRSQRSSSPVVRERDRERNKRPERRAAVLRYEAANPHKAAARRVVKRAIEAGRLPKQPCIVCGDAKVEAHHEDYNEPLAVVWLCRSHHVQHHYGRLSLPDSNVVSAAFRRVAASRNPAEK